jgi:hypothetical protein
MFFNLLGPFLRISASVNTIQSDKGVEDFEKTQKPSRISPSCLKLTTGKVPWEYIKIVCRESVFDTAYLVG